jgi:transposase
MKASSQDLRERVLRAVDQGYQRADIIKLFAVSRATIKRYLKQRRETGAVNVKAIPGRPPKKLAPLQAHLLAQLEAHPDATLEADCQLWQEQQGVAVSTSTMSRAIKRVGWTRKKRRWVKLPATKRHAPPGENSFSTWTPASSSSSMSVGPTLV